MPVDSADSTRLKDAAEAIETLCADYKPAGGISQDRVIGWAERFDEPDRAVIVHELAAILSRSYISEVSMRNLLRRFLRRVLLTSDSPKRELDDIRFLDIQRQGTSQTHLLELMDEVLAEKGLSRRTDDEPAGTYVYLDDGIHTGNAIRYDLTASSNDSTPAWIPNQAPEGCRLLICAIGIHERGWTHYAKHHVEKAAQKKAITVEEAWHLWILDTDRYCPQSTDGVREAARNYVQALEDVLESRGVPKHRCLRQTSVPGLCETPEGRQVLERAFLDLGADLRKSTQKENNRPLGYDTLDTLGFGSPLVSYRNIPNTAPLALWYGPGSLFPRA